MVWVWRKVVLMVVCNIWFLVLIIVSGFVFLGFVDFGMFICFVRYFFVCSCFVMCLNYFWLMWIRSWFFFWKIFYLLVIFFFFMSLDWMYWYVIMSVCGLVIMLMIFWYFVLVLGFSFWIWLVVGSFNLGRRSRIFLIFSFIYCWINEVFFCKFLWWFYWDCMNCGFFLWIGLDFYWEFFLGI